jgi:hypothetical protein
MLQNLSPEVSQCLRHADDCATRARCEPDPALRRDFFDMELRWFKLARSYQYAGQLKSFTSHNKQRSEELTRQLEQLKHISATRWTRMTATSKASRNDDR